MMDGKLFRAIPSLGVLLLVTVFPGCGKQGVQERELLPRSSLLSKSEKTSDIDPNTQVLTVVVSNQGGADLRIGSVSTSCGCSQAKTDQENVPPGQTATIVVEGKPPETGHRLVEIRIPTNDPARPELTVKWDLVSRVTAPKLLTNSPSVDFGIVRPDNLLSSRSVTLEIMEEHDRPPLSH